MSVTRIASRYAKSLIDLAQEQGKLERILQDVQGFNKATEQRDFELLLKSPIVNIDKKKAVIKSIFGGKFDELTMTFMDVVLRKGREIYLPAIATEFIAQYKAIKRISTIKLTTAVPIEASALETIKKQLLNSKSTSDNVEIQTVVNPNLIGGFVIEFNDKLYDASVAHKLDMLRKEFSTTK